MAEHDQRFKTLLKEFLADFLRLFFPDYVSDLDLSAPEWLDKEVLTDPPAGDVYILDLVARLRPLPVATAADPTVLAAVILLEVESRDAVATFRPRMYHYYEAVRRMYEGRVLPIALYLRVGLDGIGVETYTEAFGPLEVLRFQYLYVGLPALDAERYVQGPNWLGVALAALMKVPDDRRAWLRAEALRRVLLECRENDFRRLLLFECIEAYLALSPRQESEYKELLARSPYKEMMPVMTTTFEKGIQKGRRDSIRELLEKRFGPLKPVVEQRLNDWPADRLSDLLLAVPDAPSLQALGLEDALV
jgi:hypothetical protein